MELKKVISSLNQELYELHGEVQYGFSYITNGYVEVVRFEEEELWSSESDDREWIEAENDYEPFEPFIKRIFNEWADKISKLKFKENNEFLLKEEYPDNEADGVVFCGKCGAIK